MSFLNWLENNYTEDLQSMHDEDKCRAVFCFMSDGNLKEIVMQGMRDYMVEDGHLASAMIVSDEQAGKDVKDSLYSCFESEIVDAMEAYSRYKIGAGWLSEVLEVLL